MTTREELEQLALEVAGSARHRARVAFQVRHPHYTLPPGTGEGNEAVLRLAHERAKSLYGVQAQSYSRLVIWTALGIDMKTLLEALEAP